MQQGMRLLLILCLPSGSRERWKGAQGVTRKLRHNCDLGCVAGAAEPFRYVTFCGARDCSVFGTVAAAVGCLGMGSSGPRGRSV